MDRTPERPSRSTIVTFAIASDENTSPRRSPRQNIRVKKNPSVTPKRFTKFFTPRPRNAHRAIKASRKVLQELTAARLNSQTDRSLAVSINEHGGRPNKKRKLSFTSIASIPSSPIRKDSFYSNNHDAAGTNWTDGDHRMEEACYSSEDEEESIDVVDANPSPLIPYRGISCSAGLLSKRLGGRTTITEANDSQLWQHETAHFYSTPEDFASYTNPNQRFPSLPFCAASFNSRDLVAIGDEEGIVRIHCVMNDPHNNGYIKYPKIERCLRPHDNAIMDLELSADDSVIATASGDQTCHIVDVERGQARYTLTGHCGSVKRIQFQPGSNNQLVVTCSRDGSVCLWDLRCARDGAPKWSPKIERLGPNMTDYTQEVNAVNDIRDAHTPYDRLKRQNFKGKQRASMISARNDFAVTACTFISESRSHLLATASENDAIIKLWDMRTSYVNRAGRPIPVSATHEPKSHEDHRQFGVTSISMNTDGSRLYSLCRDHTIYAYSTSHLILGSAPEMQASSTAQARPPKQAAQGLGPLYGFRHPTLRISSFYDKLAVRKAHTNRDDPYCGGITELLAVGSGEECAVVFPTSERYLNKANQRAPDVQLPSRPRLTRSTSTISNAGLEQEKEPGACPIYHHGTALVGGHKKEVTAVAWAHNGNLVTVADDCTTRVWRENASKARALRQNSERDVGRFNSGWAEVRAGFDNEE